MVIWHDAESNIFRAIHMSLLSVLIALIALIALMMMPGSSSRIAGISGGFLLLRLGKVKHRLFANGEAFGRHRLHRSGRHQASHDVDAVVHHGVLSRIDAIRRRDALGGYLLIRLSFRPKFEGDGPV